MLFYVITQWWVGGGKVDICPYLILTSFEKQSNGAGAGLLSFNHYYILLKQKHAYFYNIFRKRYTVY